MFEEIDKTNVLVLLGTFYSFLASVLMITGLWFFL